MQEELKQMYEDLMGLAYNMEDKLGYDETRKGREFGKIVNSLQNFKL